MDDQDKDNDQYEGEGEDDNNSSKSSLSKYFNKSYSARTFINTNNTIKLNNGLKLIIDASVNANQKYKGKYNLYFDWWERSIKFKLKFSDNQNKNLDLSVKHKAKFINNPLIDKYSVSYSVDTHQKMITQLSFSKKLQGRGIDCNVDPRVEFQKGNIKWMVSSKITYKFPEYKGLSNKISLKFKKLTPQLSIHNCLNFSQINSKINLDTKFSKDSKYYLNKLQLQYQYKNFTSIIQHQKSNTLYLHYEWHPTSIGIRIREPDDKNWWQVALNRRLSSKKMLQLSLDNKRWAFMCKQVLNTHTHFYFKFYNNYEKDIFKNFKSNTEIGFKFND